MAASATSRALAMTFEGEEEGEARAAAAAEEDEPAAAFLSAASTSARRIALARPRVVRQLPSIRIGDVMLKSIGT